MAANGMQFTDRAQKALGDAHELATQYAHSQILPLHLAVSLLDPPVDESKDQQNTGHASHASSAAPLFKQVVERAHGDPQLLDRALKKALVRLPSQEPPPEHVSVSPAFSKVLRRANEIQKTQKDSYVAVDHLVIALSEDDRIAACLAEANIPKAKLVVDAVSSIRGTRRVDSKTADGEEENENLKKFSIDMTALAREGKLDPVIGREEEIRRVIRILSRRTKNNPVLIGEPGVGKTTVVEGLAQRIVNADVPAHLATCRLLSLDVGALVAGAKYKGEFEERIKGVLNEVEKSKDMIVLFVDEMHLLMGAGSSGEGGMDAANLLKPMLARGQLHCIGATTLNEYRKYIEKDQAFERRFQQVLVKEPTVADTISILRGVKEKYEVHHGVNILDGALVAAATLASRYITARRLPDSAVDLVDEAAAAVRVARDSQPEALDDLDRRQRQLQIEIHALERDSGPDVAPRLEQAKQELANVQEELIPLREKYEKEKERSREIQEARQKLDGLSAKLEAAKRDGDYQLASDLQYYAMPDLNKRIEELERQKQKAEQSSKGAAAEGPLVADAVGPDQINEIVSRWTGIPVTRLRTTEKEKLINMEEALGKIVVGQKEAVQAVANAIRLQRSGLSDPNQPPSFLFCGPSGTGKTLLTKALAEFLFNDPKAMIRFDMSEYQERHALSRMIGAPPGYVGHDAGGQLTEALRRRPFSILLFDEVEKAAKEILTVMLQLMDDGRITDGQGRTVDASNCIVVMTSNLGAEFISDPNDKSEEISADKKSLVENALRRYFLPEFLNRIHSTVIFNRLSKKELRRIVDLRIAEVQKRMLNNDRKVFIDCSNDVKKYLGEAGYDHAYGARPLGRLIEREILNKLAVLILNGQVRDGETARIIMRNNRVVVEPNHTESDDSDAEMVDGREGIDDSESSEEDDDESLEDEDDREDLYERRR